MSVGRKSNEVSIAQTGYIKSYWMEFDKSKTGFPVIFALFPESEESLDILFVVLGLVRLLRFSSGTGSLEFGQRA
jgi:hypothetical protein